MADYGDRAREEVEKAIHEFEYHGKYKSRQQAIAAGLNKAKGMSVQS